VFAVHTISSFRRISIADGDIILNVLFAGKINKKTKYVIISPYKAALEGNI